MTQKFFKYVELSLNIRISYWNLRPATHISFVTLTTIWIRWVVRLLLLLLFLLQSSWLRYSQLRLKIAQNVLFYLRNIYRTFRNLIKFIEFILFNIILQLLPRSADQMKRWIHVSYIDAFIRNAPHRLNRVQINGSSKLNCHPDLNADAAKDLRIHQRILVHR